MKNLLHKIDQNRYFLLFILLFAYVQSIHSRVAVRGTLNAYTFTPEAALATLVAAGILFLVIRFFIRRWQRSTVYSTKELLKIFGSSLMVYLLIIQLWGLVLAFAFGTVERNFNRETFALSAFTDLLDGVIYGSFFLAYYYYNKNKKHQQQLAAHHQALLESRVNQLKTQLNPHFLFNNLNVLDQLIEEDKHEASEFLNEFADIYRYVLQSTDKTLTTVQKELAFAKQYFKLIQHKYGTAYQLQIEGQTMSGNIVPLTLQLLIENAVQHNLGTAENPVCIRIEGRQSLQVSNNIIAKRNPKPTSGRALNNLKEQYKLLAGKPIEIQISDYTFAVIVPLIHTAAS